MAGSTDLGPALQRADALYALLLDCLTGPLPHSAVILRALPELRTTSGVSSAFRSLERRGRIEQRFGTRHCQGHRIVRIVATGAVLRTAGCELTFDDPWRQPRNAAGVTTVARVLKAVEDCADRGARLPRAERLGVFLGRSAGVVRLALNVLHDSGQLRLIQRGTRRAAELPDGRRTL
jgi:hypothetical protein